MDRFDAPMAGSYFHKFVEVSVNGDKVEGIYSKNKYFLAKPSHPYRSSFVRSRKVSWETIFSKW